MPIDDRNPSAGDGGDGISQAELERVLKSFQKERSRSRDWPWAR